MPTDDKKKMAMKKKVEPLAMKKTVKPLHTTTQAGRDTMRSAYGDATRKAKLDYDAKRRELQDDASNKTPRKEIRAKLTKTTGDLAAQRAKTMGGSPRLVVAQKMTKDLGGGMKQETRKVGGRTVSSKYIPEKAPTKKAKPIATKKATPAKVEPVSKKKAPVGRSTTRTVTSDDKNRKITTRTVKKTTKSGRTVEKEKVRKREKGHYHPMDYKTTKKKTSTSKKGVIRVRSKK
jgi:hypothetical protein